MWRCVFVILLFLCAIAGPVRAVQPDEVLSDSALESRARNLSRVLRCMVCQNQSIDDSEAPLARDLRLLVRERLTRGDSDQEVLDFLVSRYGEFVLLKPPFDETHFAPVGIAATCSVCRTNLAFDEARRISLRSEPECLSQEEERRLSTLVDPSRSRPLIIQMNRKNNVLQTLQKFNPADRTS